MNVKEENALTKKKKCEAKVRHLISVSQTF